MLFLFGFGNLIYITVLLLNAVCILSEDRFLARIGWARTSASQNPQFGQYSSVESESAGQRIAALINSIRLVARVPLIAANLIIIGYEILLG